MKTMEGNYDSIQFESGRDRRGDLGIERVERCPQKRFKNGNDTRAD